MGEFRKTSRPMLSDQDYSTQLGSFPIHGVPIAQLLEHSLLKFKEQASTIL